MLIDIVVEPFFNPQLVAGQLEKYAGLTSIIVYWDARIVRGEIADSLTETLERFPGVFRAMPSDGSQIAGARALVIRPSDVSLGFSDPMSLLSPEARVQLEDDLERIAAASRAGWEKARNTWLD